MARMSNHEVVERYRIPESDVVYHVTANGRVLRTTGPRMGGAKIVMTIDGTKFWAGGIAPAGARRATAEEWKRGYKSFGFFDSDGGDAMIRMELTMIVWAATENKTDLERSVIRAVTEHAEPVIAVETIKTEVML